MIKKLTKVGTSMGLVIDKALLDLYQFESEVEILPLPDGLVIRPADAKARERRKSEIKAAMSEMDERFSGMLKNLAK